MIDRIKIMWLDIIFYVVGVVCVYGFEQDISCTVDQAGEDSSLEGLQRVQCSSSKYLGLEECFLINETLVDM